MERHRPALMAMLTGLLLLIPPVAEARKIPVRTLPAEQAAIARASAMIRGESLLVSGKVRRYHPLHTPGLVEIAVYGPDGTLVGRIRERLPGLMSQRRGLMEFTFSGRFPFVPPEGSAVLIRYRLLPAMALGR